MYQVKVLSSEEFDQLPYPSMETSLGVADPKTSTAYVRYTGIDSVDKYLINHELEHLIEGHCGEHSSHYKNGVYYKDMQEVFNYGSKAGAVASMFIPGMQWAAPMLWSGSDQLAPTQGARKRSRDIASRGNEQSFGFSGEQSQGSPMEQFQPS